METTSLGGCWGRTWDGFASPELTTVLTKIGTLRTLSNRDLLYQRGTPGTELYGIRSGYVRLSAVTESGQEGIIGIYGPGTWFGEVSFFDAGPRPANAQAIGRTEVLVVSAAQLRSILEANPIWYRDFARVLCNKLRVAVNNLASALLPASVRVALRLLDLAEAYGITEPEGILIRLNLPQDELARMLGLTRQAVNIELRAFERPGLIKLSRGKIQLRDVDGLRRYVRQGGGGDLLGGDLSGT